MGLINTTALVRSKKIITLSIPEKALIWYDHMKYVDWKGTYLIWSKFDEVKCTEEKERIHPEIWDEEK